VAPCGARAEGAAAPRGCCPPAPQEPAAVCGVGRYCRNRPTPLRRAANRPVNRQARRAERQARRKPCRRRRGRWQSVAQVQNLWRRGRCVAAAASPRAYRRLSDWRVLNGGILNVLQLIPGVSIAAQHEECGRPGTGENANQYPSWPRRCPTPLPRGPWQPHCLYKRLAHAHRVRPSRRVYAQQRG